jgi:hypothetical protein
MGQKEIAHQKIDQLAKMYADKQKITLEEAFAIVNKDMAWLVARANLEPKVAVTCFASTRETCDARGGQFTPSRPGSDYGMCCVPSPIEDDDHALGKG